MSAPITELAPATSTPTVGINLSQSTNSIIEGNSGTTYAPVIVELSAPSDKEITVNYRYQTSYASGGSSETTTGTLTFAPGQTRATIAIPVEGDTIYEGTDYLRIVITDATNAVVVIDGAEPGRYNYMDLRILNDDVEETPNPSVTVGFPRNSTTVVEGNNGPRTEPITIELSDSSTQPITVHYTISPFALDGATDGEDFIAESGSVTFAPAKPKQPSP
ncbi:hypothetical protein MMUR_55730 [Mycolicibacterium murale]|uniref:Calx-beta domain-containing protein n=1 Tax=Mycolicibacterium murale TaxID=182220 RepID=A0A7I9WW51_9MYCO|nr:Calx-beta domain-containing protein [Mycolicibacterium murale]GFG61437.1 hypothetical protein MMUR_55730 [Mycolicibacterium murale]